MSLEAWRRGTRPASDLARTPQKRARRGLERPTAGYRAGLHALSSFREGRFMGRTRGSKHQFEETGGDSKRRGRRPNRTVREGLDAMRSVQRPRGESLTHAPSM